MPTTTKKPASKLKAGQKKPINKWLIAAGAAAVVALGLLVVRYSSAATNIGSPVSHKTGKWTLTTQGLLFSSMTTKLNAGSTYLMCFRGYSTGKTSTVLFQPTAFSTTKTVTTNTVYCSKPYKVTSSNNFFPAFYKKSGPNITITAVSINKL